MKPEGSKVNYQELAERFYTLDTEVYEASGSELGKVFPGPKHISVKQILKDFEREDTEKLKDELILIGNMIKIIEENGGRYEELFIRYEHLCNDMMAVMEKAMVRMWSAITRMAMSDFSSSPYFLPAMSPMAFSIGWNTSVS